MKISLGFLMVIGSSQARLSASHHQGQRKALATFPLYSQQCDQDEGPRVEDDAETFGAGVKYHHDSPASPVLLANGECADPLKAACSIRNDPKLAYMEGPIDCGGNGFFCTVVEQEDWDPRELLDNLNFGYCNRTEAFDNDPDEQYQEDGHCHGSDHDSAYYWVLRDHWFRQYNGRLRCCCNWDQGEDPLTNGLFTNRCDYRRRVPERLDGDCRNANKAIKNFEDGCDPSVQELQIGNPVPENDARCWEVLNFGEPNDDGEGEDDSEGEDDDIPLDDDDESLLVDECVDDSEFRFRNMEKRDCEWVGRRPNIRCQRIWDGLPLEDFCPKACGVCE